MYYIHCYLGYKVILIKPLTDYYKGSSFRKSITLAPIRVDKSSEDDIIRTILERRINLLVVRKNDYVVKVLEGGKTVYMTHIPIFLPLRQPSQHWALLLRLSFPLWPSHDGQEVQCSQG